MDSKSLYTEPISGVVTEHIKDYFAKELSAYKVCEVYRKSNHIEDRNLYMITAIKKDGTYACWTSWNESTHSLNYGHYDISDYGSCIDILKSNFNDISAGSFIGFEETKRKRVDFNKEEAMQEPTNKRRVSIDSIIEKAEALYSMCEDMDHGDYEDHKDEEISLLSSALEKINDYACWNEDFKALNEALNIILDNQTQVITTRR